MVERPDPAVAFRGTPPASVLPGWYPELLASVTQHVSTGHRRAVAAANTELLAAYWAIGRAILARQHEEGYGTKVIDRLSADLRERFPDARGHSPRNLKYMRAFAAAWPDWEVVQGSLARLPWYHQIALIEKLDRPELRLRYAAAALDEGWSQSATPRLPSPAPSRSASPPAVGRNRTPPSSPQSCQAPRTRTSRRGVAVAEVGERPACSVVEVGGCGQLGQEVDVEPDVVGVGEDQGRGGA